MRLSSVSLIAAALAATAGSVMAAPRPLHARALEDVNSLSERDVDVHSRESGLALLEREVDDEFGNDLFIRTDPNDRARHIAAAAARVGAAKEARKAAACARKAHDKAQEAAMKANVIAEHNRVVHRDDHSTDDYRKWGSDHGKNADVYHEDGHHHNKMAIEHDKHEVYHTGMARGHSPAVTYELGDSVKSPQDSILDAAESRRASYAAITSYSGVIDRLMGHIQEYDTHPAVREYNLRRHGAAVSMHALRHGRQ